MKRDARLEISVVELVALFKHMGWKYAVPGKGVVLPNPQDIENVIFEIADDTLNLSDELEEEENYIGTVHSEIGRFLGKKEPGFNAVQLYLHIGQVDVEDDGHDVWEELLND